MAQNCSEESFVKFFLVSGPLFLNREVVNLLVSVAPQTTARIMELLEEALRDTTEALTDEVSAAKVLAAVLPDLELRKLSGGFSPVGEPWLRSLVRFAKFLDLQQLKKKANIPVKQGARLIGVPDPSRVLRDGQICCNVKVCLCLYSVSLVWP